MSTQEDYMKLFDILSTQKNKNKTISSWDIETPWTEVKGEYIVPEIYDKHKYKVHYTYNSSNLDKTADKFWANSVIQVSGEGQSASALPTPPSTMWTALEAKQLIKRLQDWSRAFNYHVCLGGGVLNKGTSKKDVDIYFLPLSNGKINQPARLLRELQALMKAELVLIGNEYTQTNMAPYIFKGKMLVKYPAGDKRIDFFLLGSELDKQDLKKGWKINLEEIIEQTVEIMKENIVHFKKEKHAEG